MIIPVTVADWFALVVAFLLTALTAWLYYDIVIKSKFEFKVDFNFLLPFEKTKS